MIKVLVVDDDKLVRKGLISAMPWEEFGMRVVGEASNGEKALEFLESQPVDLLVTDLAMPVMSGIELMRAVRERYPGLHTVVLTLHQDFEYIQEALRLGAIDYIAKVQLEQEQFEEVLGRIARRINEQTQLKTVNPDQVIPLYEQGLVLLSLDRETDHDVFQELQPSTRETTFDMDRNCRIWFTADDTMESLFGILSGKARRLPEGILLVLSGFRGNTWKEMQMWVRAYTEDVLFYEYHPDFPVISVSMRDGYQADPRPGVWELESVKESWLHTAWFQNDGSYEKLIQDLKSLRLHKSQLTGLLYSLVMEWNRLFAHTQIGKIPMIPAFNSWFQVEQWMSRIRRKIQESVQGSSYAPEIIDSMTRAVVTIKDEINRQLTAAEMAQRLNLSRSYFSQCFKDIIGKPFNEYSRSIRVEKAKEYLLNTNKTILWIAEKTGYSDEKYFSRVFREITGMLPSEYRQAKRMGGEPGD